MTGRDASGSRARTMVRCGCERHRIGRERNWGRLPQWEWAPTLDRTAQIARLAVL